MDRQTATNLLSECAFAFEQIVGSAVPRAFDELYQAGCRDNNGGPDGRSVITQVNVDLFDSVFGVSRSTSKN